MCSNWIFEDGFQYLQERENPILLQQRIEATNNQKMPSKWRIGCKFLDKFHETGCLLRQPGSGRPSKVTAEIKKIVDDQMDIDDETTAHQLHSFLCRKGYNISIRTVLRCWSKLGWTFRGSAYCQLIRHVNKEKRLDFHFAQKFKDDNFLDVIYTDESSIQMESHRRFAAVKKANLLV